MINYPRICKERGIDYIFDPGQSLPMLNGEDLIEAASGCRVLICNDYELDLIIKKTGLVKEALLERTGTLITTLGDLGSKVNTTRRRDKYPPCKGETGARPYRGGRLLQGRAGHRSRPGVGDRALRPDGQRLRLLCRRVLRDTGIPLQRRRIQRKAEGVLPVATVSQNGSTIFVIPCETRNPTF